MSLWNNPDNPFIRWLTRQESLRPLDLYQQWWKPLGLESPVKAKEPLPEPYLNRVEEELEKMREGHRNPPATWHGSNRMIEGVAASAEIELGAYTYGGVTRTNNVGIYGTNTSVPITLAMLRNAMPQQTPEELEAIRLKDEAEAKRKSDLEAARIAAEQKAEALLSSVVTGEEWYSWTTRGYIDVRNQWAYRIQRHGQTRVTDKDGNHGRACIQFPYGSNIHAPTDRVVAEYLLIKSDELKYLATANITWEPKPQPWTAERSNPRAYNDALTMQEFNNAYAGIMDSIRLRPIPRIYTHPEGV